MSASSERARPLALDDLIALNDEIAALVRAGLPLEGGLAAIARDVPGRLRGVTSDLAERLATGASLADALAASNYPFPPAYRALVAAGVRSGRSAELLSDLAASARRLADVRRVVSSAIFYPLLVVLIAYVLFLFLLCKVLPTWDVIDRLNNPLLQRALPALRSMVWFWGPAVPLLVVTTAVVWWRASRQALLLQSSRAAWLLAWVPGARRLLAAAQSAAFNDLLAVLVEHEVPLAEALTLAADAVGSTATQQSARALAAQLTAGQLTPAAPAARDSALTPLVRWILGGTHSAAILSPLLRGTADIARRRALRQAEWLRTYLPALLTAVLGGGTVLLYACSVFWPFAKMLHGLANQFGNI